MVDDIGDAMVAIGWLRERRKLLMLTVTTEEIFLSLS